MFICIRFRFLQRLSSLSHSSLSRSLKWVSTATALAKTPSPQVPQDYFLVFSDGRLNRNQQEYELALVSALKSYASLSGISQGRQLHCLVLKSGLHSNTFICNSIISMYAKCGFIDNAKMLFDACSWLDPVSCNIMVSGYVKAGRLEDARYLFDIMPGKSVVSYTAMIMGLVQNACWKEALEVFKDMTCSGVVPNELTLVNIFSACMHLAGLLMNCRVLHALVVKLQLEASVLVTSNLLHAYCFSSSVKEARKLFDAMPERNIVSWNIMLNGYSKMGLVGEATELFEIIPAKDIISWGTLIDGFIQIDSIHDAILMYRDMTRTGLGPNDVMIVNLISSCGRLMAFSEGLQFHGITVKKGFDCYNFIQATIIHFYAANSRMSLAFLQFEMGLRDHKASWNALIAGFIRNGMIDQARKMFDAMPDRDVFSWSTMISGYTQSEQPNIALEIFHQMIYSGIPGNEFTMVSVFSAIASLGTLSEGAWALDYLRSNCIPLNDNLNAAIIDMYAKCGSIKTALEYFYRIKNSTSTASPWNAIICGLAMHGHAGPCVDFFSEMERRDIRPNSITFIGVLSSCCHSGSLELGRKIFNSMKNVYNVEPNIKHYGCMVDLLGRAGLLEEAEDMVMNMPMKPDTIIWGTLLAACKTHGNVDVGERAEKSLAELDTSHGASKVLLSNLFADAGRWEDAFLVRGTIRSQKMKRMPGFSGVV